MVTDEQYRALQDRVSDLENKLASLSRQFSALYMRRDSAQDEPSHKEVTVHRDVTRYRFNGEKLCKRSLVLACVKQYIKDNDIKEACRLKEAFPDYIQGSLGIVKTIDEAERYSEAHRRFYFKDGDIIKLEDALMVVCCQWDVKNTPRFINLMNDLGYEIEIIERKY